MASLEFYGKDEYGNGNSINLPDFTDCLLLATTPTPPAGTLVADGSEVSREAYAKLFAIFGTQYGAGDGVSTFALPDWRDEFPRFSGTSRTVGTKQTDAMRNMTGNLQIRSSQNINEIESGTTSGTLFATVTTTLNPSGIAGVFNVSSVIRQEGAYNPIAVGQSNQNQAYQNISFDASRLVSTADENRPRNVAFLPCVIYV